MLIDQFTPEQIEQIKKELKYTEFSHKQKVTNIADKLREVFPLNREAPEDEEAVWLARMCFKDMIYEMADLTLKNVTYVHKSSNKTKNLQRGSIIKPDMQEEYIQFIDEILAVIEKHKK